MADVSTDFILPLYTLLFQSKVYPEPVERLVLYHRID